MNVSWKWVFAVAVLLLAGIIGLMLRQGLLPFGPRTPPAAAPPPVAAPAQAPVQAPAASEPAIHYPIDTASAPALGPAGPEQVLAEVFGAKPVRTLFQLQDFPRRFVATVDNLGRSQAPSGLWPVNPTGGRFSVERRGEALVLGADNAQRYTPYVLLLENVDMSALAAAYARLYPSFQQAYEELGFPGRYFNDRLVQVIDQLLATPIPEGPLKMHLPTIAASERPQRPWVLYEFDDPALQSLSAGQRVLLRMGPVNERRVKARLAEFRRLVAGEAARR
jgi:hypothetical protein